MTRKNQFEQFLEELVCLCHAQQPVSTTRNNQFFNNQSQFQQPGRTSFELVTTSFNHKEKPVWASYSQFQPAVRTRKNQFELVCSHAQQPVSTTRKNQFELDTASFNDKENQFWASFNNQEEPVLS